MSQREASKYTKRPSKHALDSLRRRGYKPIVVRLKPNYEARMRELLELCDQADQEGNSKMVLNGHQIYTSAARHAVSLIAPELLPWG